VAKRETAARISETGKLLFEYHQAYEDQLKREVPQKEFALYIGIDDKYYNHIYKGRQRPGKEIAKLLAEFFDDLRFYDAGGYDRPDPRFFYVQRNWEELSDGVTKKIEEIVAEYLGKKKK
jgi:DNA-binding XRE family transcriptional regulator